MEQTKENKAHQPRRTLILFSDPARKAQLDACYVGCNECNRAAHDLGLSSNRHPARRRHCSCQLRTKAPGRFRRLVVVVVVVVVLLLLLSSDSQSMSSAGDSQ